jgi:GTP cyclohydrolase II
MHEKLEQILRDDPDHECEGVGREKVCVRIVAMAELPTRFGDFHIVAFENNRDGKEHIAITKGDVMGSLRCDCRDQLEAALKMIGKMDRGIVLYLRQEGRGIGLINKIRAYSLQDEGLDTVQANLALGFRDDERDYAVAAHMLMSLKIRSARLITNNPKKIQQLTDYGINVSDRIPHVMQPNEHNRFYLETKVAKSGHMIDFTGREHLQEQSDEVFLDGMTPMPWKALHD